MDPPFPCQSSRMVAASVVHQCCPWMEDPQISTDPTRKPHSKTVFGPQKKPGWIHWEIGWWWFLRWNVFQDHGRWNSNLLSDFYKKDVVTQPGDQNGPCQTTITCSLKPQFTTSPRAVHTRHQAPFGTCHFGPEIRSGRIPPILPKAHHPGVEVCRRHLKLRFMLQIFHRDSLPVTLW